MDTVATTSEVVVDTEEVVGVEDEEGVEMGAENPCQQNHHTHHL